MTKNYWCSFGNFFWLDKFRAGTYMKYQPFLIIFAFSLHRLPYLQVCHDVSLASFPPNRAYPDGDAMSGMRYADTNFLIVTCYLLPQGWKCRCAFVLPSLQLRSHRWSINGLTTEVERYCIGGCTWAFLASLHRFPCGVNEFSMMSTESWLCKPFKENDNLSSIMSTNAV